MPTLMKSAFSPSWATRCLVLTGLVVSIIAGITPAAVNQGGPVHADAAEAGWVVFTRDPTPADPEGSDAELWGMAPDGSGATRLTNDTCADLTPDASPDGRWVAWQKKCGSRQDVWIARVASSQPGSYALTQARNITAVLGGGQDRWPQFSPDGTKMAFMRLVSGNFDIWRADLRPDVEGVPSLANAVRVVRLGSDPLVEDCCVTWSPDGRRLVWASNVNLESKSFDLFRIDATLTDVLDATTNRDGSPDGSLDPAVSQRIASLPYYEGTPAYDADGTVLFRCNCPNGDIYRINPDTGVRTRLTTYQGLDRTPEGFPGGILYSRQDANGSDEIYRAGYSGESPTNLTRSPNSDRDPTWSP